VRPDRSYRYIYDLPDEALANLAYYFEHDYADGRDPTTYTAGLDAAMRRWTDNTDKSGLVYVDDGSTLTLQDFRVGAARLTTSLTGVERELYLFCDQNRSPRQIVAYAEELGGTESETEDFLRRMLELHVMATADGRYLSLALPARSLSSEEDVAGGSRGIAMSDDDMRELRQKLAVWGQTLSQRERAFLENLVGADLLAAGSIGQSGKGKD
jgi:hypothetical protein